MSSGLIIGLLQKKPSDWLGIKVSKDNLDSDFIEELIEERNIARSKKNFTEADQIRDKLRKKGIEIEDTPEGTVWRSLKK